MRVIDLSRRFTPGGRYRDSIKLDGPRRIVREPDGILLNEAVADVAADLVLDEAAADVAADLVLEALRRDRDRP